MANHPKHHHMFEQMLVCSFLEVEKGVKGSADGLRSTSVAIVRTGAMTVSRTRRGAQVHPLLVGFPPSSALWLSLIERAKHSRLDGSRNFPLSSQARPRMQTVSSLRSTQSPRSE